MRVQPENLGGGEVVIGPLALMPAGHHRAGRDEPGERTEVLVKRTGQDRADVRFDAYDLQ